MQHVTGTTIGNDDHATCTAQQLGEVFASNSLCWFCPWIHLGTQHHGRVRPSLTVVTGHTVSNAASRCHIAALDGMVQMHTIGSGLHNHIIASAGPTAYCF